MVEATPAVITAIVILTVGSIFLILYLWKKYKELGAIWANQNKWPPMYNRCPDYWEDKGTNNAGFTVCKNVHRLGNNPDKETAEFLDPNLKKDNLINICKDAKTLGLTWEGVENVCA